MISDAYVNVECDICGETSDPIGLTSLGRGGWDERNVERALARMGWIAKDDKHFCCDECAEKMAANLDSQL